MFPCEVKHTHSAQPQAEKALEGEEAHHPKEAGVPVVERDGWGAGRSNVWV